METNKVIEPMKYPVIYFRCNNFDSRGNLINQPFFSDKLVIIFIHKSDCIHCIRAAPSYMKAARINQDPRIYFTAIQVDSKNTDEKNCKSIFKFLVKDFVGYPSYAFIYKNKILDVTLPGRSSRSLLNTANDIIRTM